MSPGSYHAVAGTEDGVAGTQNPAGASAAICAAAWARFPAPENAVVRPVQGELQETTKVPESFIATFPPYWCPAVVSLTTTSEETARRSECRYEPRFRVAVSVAGAVGRSPGRDEVPGAVGRDVRIDRSWPVYAATGKSPASAEPSSGLPREDTLIGRGRHAVPGHDELAGAFMATWEP